jgi:hypothetical protein
MINTNKPSRIKGNPHNKPFLLVDRSSFRKFRRLFRGAVLLLEKNPFNQKMQNEINGKRQ